jgi:hypothetical protein
VSDINGGVYPNAPGSPIFPGTAFTGPLLAGNVQHSDGSTALAALGETNIGQANVGYCVMAQAQPITQATNGTVAGVYTSALVIPAQSQILRITMMVTTAWSGAALTFGIGNTVSATAYTAAAVASGSTLGIVTLTPGANATAIGNWDNVGNSDVAIVVTSTNTGAGVGTLTVEYIQAINQAS